MIVPFELSRLQQPVFEALTRAALAERSPFFHALAATKKSAAGDPKAAAQIADRLEGKAPQALELGGVDSDPAPAAITIQFVESDGNGSRRYVDREGRPLSEWQRGTPSED